MAQPLRHQGSSLFDERNHPGGVWGLRHFLELHHRYHIRKRLTYSKDADGKHDGGAKITKVDQNVHLNGEKHALFEREGDSLMDGKNRNSSNAHMQFLFSKIHRKKNSNKKISPSASRLMRTTSIHYLECDDYVLPGEMTSESEKSATDLCSNGTDSSANSDPLQELPGGSDKSYFGKQGETCGTLSTIYDNQLNEFRNHLPESQAVLIEMLNEAKKAFSQEVRDDKESVSFQELKDLSDIVEFFGADKNLFLKFLKDPNYIFTNYLCGQQASNAMAVFTKSGSFPVAGSPGRRTSGLCKLHDKQNESEHFETHGVKFHSWKSFSSTSTTEDSSRAVESTPDAVINNLKPWSKAMGKSKSSSSLEIFLVRPDELKSEKEGGIISSRFKDLKLRINETRKEHLRISLDGILHKIPYGQKVFEDAKKEKLRDGPAEDRYNMDGPRSRFIGDVPGFMNGKFVNKSIQRSHSLTESLNRYAHLLESTSFKESKRLSERLKLAQEDGLQVQKSQKNLGRIFSSPEFDLFPDRDLLVNEVAVDPSTDKPAESGTSVHKGDSMNLDASVGNNPQVVASDASGVDQNLEQPLLIEHDKGKLYEATDELKADESSYTLLHEQEIGKEPDKCDMPIKPTPISVLDSFQEDPLRPAKYSEDSQLKTGCTHFEEVNSVVNPHDQSVKVGPNKVQMPVELTDFNALHVHVDQRDEAEFNYVRDVLKKSGFCCGVSHGDCCSPYLPVDPLFGEVEGPSFDLDTDESDMSPDRWLLFELINEVLLEIYENSFSHYPGFLQYNNYRTRPFPVGFHVLKEVWSEISWHLSSQKQKNSTLEDVMSRDFSRNDGWLNVRRAIEFVGLELEAWILDDILDEVVFQFHDLISTLCLVA